VAEILDKLTKYVTELQNELLLRTKQYNYYRNFLLSDEYLTKKRLELCGENAELEFKQLRDICKIIRGTRVTKKDLLSDGLYPVVSGGTGYMGYLNKYNREENTITIAQYGMAGYVNWQNEKFWANDVCFCVNPIDNVDKKYLYYFLVNNQDYLYSISNRSAIPYSISRDRIYDIQIPIPPLAVQKHIVSILDQFNTITNDITQGLPKEIELRQKQYEYYRDLLLSFDSNKE
ncbi:restriction endonuclease subunit S, partial [Ureaplasma diversum]|uniref:restriction endonuclease subunit S n=1 Tax=Ureaplasma diversum TaxID=42094 RepID=UPI0005702B2C